MDRIAIIILLATATVLGSVQAQEWLPKYGKKILELHNNKRSAVVGGCNILKMKYDMELEKQAERWVNTCNFAHEIKPGRGENMGYTTSKENDWDAIYRLFIMWFNESKTYTVGQRSCGFSCHYTQIIWDTTDRVGCFFKKCPKFRLLACFYLPGGNFRMQLPFKRNCTAPCNGNLVLNDGLCIDKDDQNQDLATDQNATEQNATNSTMSNNISTNSNLCNNNTATNKNSTLTNKTTTAQNSSNNTSAQNTNNNTTATQNNTNNTSNETNSQANSNSNNGGSNSNTTEVGNVRLGAGDRNNNVTMGNNGGSNSNTTEVGNVRLGAGDRNNNVTMESQELIKSTANVIRCEKKQSKA